jgi:hypothetical protein
MIAKQIDGFNVEIGRINLLSAASSPDRMRPICCGVILPLAAAAAVVGATGAGERLLSAVWACFPAARSPIA